LAGVLQAEIQDDFDGVVVRSMVICLLDGVAFEEDVLCIFVSPDKVDGCAFCFIKGWECYRSWSEERSEIRLHHDFDERLHLGFLMDVSLWVPEGMVEVEAPCHQVDFIILNFDVVE
jgi:hypothetical protein